MEGETKYYEGPPAENTHTEDDCDRCGKRVGKRNLKPLSFFYMDKNDKNHPDMSPLIAFKTGKYVEPGYRHYKCCPNCWE